MKSGFLLIDKDASMTSQAVDREVKHRLEEKKVGHLGTLDPFATGLLIIGVGDATKLFPLLEEEKKTYLATLKLGSITDTLDPTGKILEEKKITPFDREKAEKAFRSFLGKQKQIPPKFSAVHINGKRAYQLAIKDLPVEIREKDIEIYDLSLISLSENTITFRATVSKGTYIRSLGRDIANRLSNLGYLISLRREKIGEFDVRDASQLKDISDSSLISFQKMTGFPTIQIPDGRILEKARNGNPLRLADQNQPYVFLADEKNTIALYRKEKENNYKCYKGFQHADEKN